ncbi:hypothetical protein QBC37DRAFT_404201 [Rhypophila decipiens]|uniref:Uncharacterized protein n=1 Tax=Rhypophila decipiens TaxID=261697 RepID=A0AAN7B446_9PEZI|nr:hypothetical protein QBC37DRAFT_404201 [Rhypophila decipiens]
MPGPSNFPARSGGNNQRAASKLLLWLNGKVVFTPREASAPPTNATSPSLTPVLIPVSFSGPCGHEVLRSAWEGISCCPFRRLTECGFLDPQEQPFPAHHDSVPEELQTGPPAAPKCVKRVTASSVQTGNTQNTAVGTQGKGVTSPVIGKLTLLPRPKNFPSVRTAIRWMRLQYQLISGTCPYGYLFVFAQYQYKWIRVYHRGKCSELRAAELRSALEL